MIVTDHCAIVDQKADMQGRVTVNSPGVVTQDFARLSPLKSKLELFSAVQRTSIPVGKLDGQGIIGQAIKKASDESSPLNRRQKDVSAATSPEPNTLDP